MLYDTHIYKYMILNIVTKQINQLVQPQLRMPQEIKGSADLLQTAIEKEGKLEKEYDSVRQF